VKLRLDRALLARAYGPGYAGLAAAATGLGFFAALPVVFILTLGVASVTVASFVRAVLPRRLGFLGVVPALVPLAVFATFAEVGPLPELAAGVAALALLFWCSEEPDRLPGAERAGLSALAIPAAVLGMAFASSLLLPVGEGSLGIAAALLVGCVAAVALLLGAPHTFDVDPASTS
jgi:hypothetical protein